MGYRTFHRSMRTGGFHGDHDNGPTSQLVRWPTLPYMKVGKGDHPKIALDRDQMVS